MELIDSHGKFGILFRTVSPHRFLFKNVHDIGHEISCFHINFQNCNSFECNDRKASNARFGAML